MLAERGVPEASAVGESEADADVFVPVEAPDGEGEDDAGSPRPDGVDPGEARDLEVIANGLRARLREVFRRLYLDAAAERRPGILMELMTDAEWSLQELGFELAQRELSAGNRLDAEVVRVALEGLSAADARTRATAALLVSRVAPPTAGALVGESLARETDSGAAAALLRAAARWPTAAPVDAIVRWMTPGSETFGAATEAMWLVYSPNRVAGPWRDAVLQRLRSAGDSELGADGMRLLVSLGSDRDRRRVERLLVSPDAGLRQAAAVAATLSAQTAPALVSAAELDASLFEAAIRAILRHDASVQAVVRAAGLPAPSEAIRVAGLRRLSDEAPLSSVIGAAGSGDLSASDVDALLSPIVESGTRAAEMTPALRSEAAIRLAEVRLQAGRPEAALAALNAGGGGADDARYRLARSIALCLLGQWEDAAVTAGDEAGIAAAAGRAATLLGDPAFEVRAATAMRAALESRRSVPGTSGSSPRPGADD